MRGQAKRITVPPGLLKTYTELQATLQELMRLERAIKHAEHIKNVEAQLAFTNFYKIAQNRAEELEKKLIAIVHKV